MKTKRARGGQTKYQLFAKTGDAAPGTWGSLDEFEFYRQE